TDSENEKKALDFLSRAGLDAPIHYHVSDALAALKETEGEFDVVYCDVDKHGYLDAWNVGKERVRVGGFYISDNMLWSGRVTGEEGDDPHPDWTKVVVATNRAIESDPRFRSVIVPLRDGVVAALRIS